MATRTIRTARWVRDEVPTVHEVYQGKGMTMLTTVEPPEKEIKCFQWSWKKPKKNDKWIYNSIAIASIAGIVATLMLVVMPIISTVVICASLAWLAFVGYANR